jgi:hypothetical protein
MRRSSELQLGPTVFYFCEDGLRLHNEWLTGSILSSFIKQLCEFLTLRFTPYPDAILKALRKFFGKMRVAPDVEDLKEIFTHLFHSVPDTTYIIDGLDTATDAKSLLDCFRQLFCGSAQQPKSQILFLSRDQIPGYINLTLFMPGIQQISTYNNNMQDIESYIKAKIKDKMMDKELTDSTTLLEEIGRDLLRKSTGMYDTSMSFLKISRS